VIDTLLGTPVEVKGPMMKEMETYGSSPGRVPAPVFSAFADMSSDVSTLAGTIAAAMTADHLQHLMMGHIPNNELAGGLQMPRSPMDTGGLRQTPLSVLW